MSGSCVCCTSERVVVLVVSVIHDSIYTIICSMSYTNKMIQEFLQTKTAMFDGVNNILLPKSIEDTVQCLHRYSPCATDSYRVRFFHVFCSFIDW